MTEDCGAIIQWKDKLSFIPHKNHQRFAWIFLVGSFDIHGPNTDQVSENYLLVSGPVNVSSLGHNGMILEEKARQITKAQETHRSQGNLQAQW